MNTENYDAHYYYARDIKPNCPGKHPLACVCVLRDKITGKHYRGISLFSVMEKKFNKQTARGLAYQRAIRAAEDGSSKFVRLTKNTTPAILALAKYGIAYGNGGIFVGEPDIQPTEYEVGVCDERQ